MTSAGSPKLRFVCDDKRHLICLPYSVENLHAMAAALRIHRCWYHHGKHPHYDIPARRVAEIMAQCEVVTARQLLALIVQPVAPPRA